MRHKSVESTRKFWNEQVSIIKCLVLHHGFKLKDVAEFYDTTVGAISTVLHRRGISLNRWRYEQSKEGK